MDDQTQKNTTDIAVMETKVSGIHERMGRLETGLEKNNEMTNTILTNHLPHLSADIQKSQGLIQVVLEKVAPVIRAVYAVIGIVMATVIAGVLALIFK